MIRTDEFLSIEAPAEATLKVRGSSFIGYAHPVITKEQAQNILETRSKQLFDATHHCYAYRLGHGANFAFRTADAGEPSGTAGRPILQAIEGKELTNIIVVITRYFGGTKLGTGGLARAYGDATSLVLDQARKVVHLISRRFQIGFPYDDTSAVMRLIQHTGAKVLQSVYDDQAHLCIEVRLSEVDRFMKEIVNLTRGKVVITE